MPPREDKDEKEFSEYRMWLVNIVEEHHREIKLLHDQVLTLRVQAATLGALGGFIGSAILYLVFHIHE